MYRLTAFILLLLTSSISFASDYTLEITQAQLQEQLVKLMPLKQEKMFVTVTLSDPTLELGIEGNKVGVYSALDVTAPGGVKGTGRAKIVGNISYKKDTGEFFLYKPTIAQIEIDQIPSSFHSNVKQLAQYALDSSVKNKPIFTLDANNPQQNMAKSMLKSVEVKPGKLLVTVATAGNEK